MGEDREDGFLQATKKKECLSKVPFYDESLSVKIRLLGFFLILELDGVFLNVLKGDSMFNPNNFYI